MCFMAFPEACVRLAICMGYERGHHIVAAAWHLRDY
jgi:hypothetical protein